MSPAGNRSRTPPFRATHFPHDDDFASGQPRTDLVPSERSRSRALDGGERRHCGPIAACGGGQVAYVVYAWRRMVEHGNPHEEIRAELEFQIGRRRRCEFAAHLQSPDAVLPLGTSSNVSSIAGKAFLDQTPASRSQPESYRRVPCCREPLRLRSSTIVRRRQALGSARSKFPSAAVMAAMFLGKTLADGSLVSAGSLEREVILRRTGPASLKYPP